MAVAALGCATQDNREGAGESSDNATKDLPHHVVDLHCDTPMLFQNESYDIGIRNEIGEVDIPRMREGGVTAVFMSVYTSASRNTELEAVQKALEITDSVRQETLRFPDDLVLATSADAIEAARRDGRIAMLIGIEGGHMINSSLGVLRSLYDLGGRYLTLTHSRDTPWAGSSGETRNTGLSEFGRSVVAEMNRLGMMVDVSHVSDQTFWDVMETTKAPIIASHSSMRAIASHKRNMDDEMVRATAEGGGVVHINYYNSFLDDEYAKRSSEWSEANPNTGRDGPFGARTRARFAAIGRPSLDTLLDHFEHAANVGGIEAVGLGSDFDGVDGELPEGVDDISNIGNIVAGLESRGFDSDAMEKILGANSLRVFRDIEAAAG